MARYTLLSFLRQTQNLLLKAFFEEKELSFDFEWYWTDPNGDKKLLIETDINGLADAIKEKLDPNDLLAVVQEFKQINWMATDDRISCLIELGKKQKFDVDLVKEFKQHGIEGCYSQSMYIYLRHEDLFNYALKVMEIIDMESARDFEVGAGLKPKIDEKSLGDFKQAVIEHYVGKGRGDKCVIDYYHKKGQVDEYCYYIFHEDCVKTVLDFDETGDGLIWKPQRHNFDNVFFFEPKTGDLHIHAGRERNCEELADLFCTHILGLDGRPNKNTKVYDLSEVKNPKFTFEYKSPIEKIHLKEIICDMGNDEEIKLNVTGKEKKGLLLKERLLAAIKSYGVDSNDVSVLKIRFEVVFKKQEGVKGRRSRTKEIILPNKTNITADDGYEKVIRQHVEKEWKFKRSLLPAKNADEAA